MNFCVNLRFITKIVRGRPRSFHHHFNTKIQYRIKMTSSETNKYKDKTDERPIRVDHSLMGRTESEGSSVDGVSHEDITEFLGGFERSQKHPFCVLLNFTTERGMQYHILLSVRKPLETFAQEYWVNDIKTFQG